MSTQATLSPSAPKTARTRAASSRAQDLPARPSTASRVLSLLFGSLTYVLFLGTFLYAIGFVTGLVVPKTVDGGAHVPLTEALLVNGGILALFAVQHTVMARRAFKRRWIKIVPQQIERSIFVLVTCAILITLYTQWRHIPGTLWAVQGPAAGFLYGLSFLGWGIVLLATFLIDHFELFGLRQVVRHFRGLPVAPPTFRERSLYKIVRHPLMLGFLVAFWATPVMTMGHLFFAAMCTGYIFFGVQVEERSLIAEHGEAYLDYRRRVRGILPLPK